MCLDREILMQREWGTDSPASRGCRPGAARVPDYSRGLELPAAQVPQDQDGATKAGVPAGDPGNSTMANPNIGGSASEDNMLAHRASSESVASHASQQSSHSQLEDSDSAKIYPRQKKSDKVSLASSGRQPLTLSFEELTKYFNMPQYKACQQLGICSTTLKKICRKFGVHRWPYSSLTIAQESQRVLKEKLERINSACSPPHSAGSGTPTALQPTGSSGSSSSKRRQESPDVQPEKKAKTIHEEKISEEARKRDEICIAAVSSAEEDDCSAEMAHRSTLSRVGGKEAWGTTSTASHQQQLAPSVPLPTAHDWHSLAMFPQSLEPPARLAHLYSDHLATVGGPPASSAFSHRHSAFSRPHQVCTADQQYRGTSDLHSMEQQQQDPVPAQGRIDLQHGGALPESNFYGFHRHQDVALIDVQAGPQTQGSHQPRSHPPGFPEATEVDSSIHLYSPTGARPMKTELICYPADYTVWRGSAEPNFSENADIAPSVLGMISFGGEPTMAEDCWSQEAHDPFHVHLHPEEAVVDYFQYVSNPTISYANTMHYPQPTTGYTQPGLMLDKDEAHLLEYDLPRAASGPEASSRRNSVHSISSGLPASFASPSSWEFSGLKRKRGAEEF